WQSQKDYIMKLRIVAKELAFQLKQWESKELSAKRSVDLEKSADIEQMLDIFIKVYFNIPADTKKIENMQRK
ncbi:MAG TPA: hypothetical protein VHO70_22535, partial [Chitinispirillaceae bacterium]|nr:hypothetical protein [Chitinispirillaceae bacterium]